MEWCGMTGEAAAAGRTHANDRGFPICLDGPTGPKTAHDVAF